jgi:very-short-patch-repair endonuclease
MIRGRKGERYGDKIAFARKMRKNPTFFEEIMWKQLKRRNLGGFKFRRQALILGWIVDFYCPQSRLVVEFDGKMHNKQMDLLRDKAMNKIGLKVLRFSNDDILIDKNKVLKIILESCQHRS